MMECWNEQPQSRPTFKWIRYAVKRLQDDEQVSLLRIFDFLKIEEEPRYTVNFCGPKTICPSIV